MLVMWLPRTCSWHLDTRTGQLSSSVTKTAASRSVSPSARHQLVIKYKCKVKTFAVMQETKALSYINDTKNIENHDFIFCFEVSVNINKLWIPTVNIVKHYISICEYQQLSKFYLDVSLPKQEQCKLPMWQDRCGEMSRHWNWEKESILAKRCVISVTQFCSLHLTKLLVGLQNWRPYVFLISL